MILTSRKYKITEEDSKELEEFEKDAIGMTEGEISNVYKDLENKSKDINSKSKKIEALASPITTFKKNIIETCKDCKFGHDPMGTFRTLKTKEKIRQSSRVSRKSKEKILKIVETYKKNNTICILKMKILQKVWNDIVIKRNNNSYYTSSTTSTNSYYTTKWGY